METQRQTAIVTPSYFVVGLLFAALLLMQACNSDRAAETQQDTSEQSRAVFGERPEQPAAEPPPPAPAEAPPPEAPPAERSARARQQPQPSVAPPPRRSADEQRSPREEQAAERFLHYRPPGSSVGDSGELGSASREALPPGSIARFVYRWADTLLSGNLDAHLNLYASPSNAVRQEKTRLLASLARPQRFEVHNLRIQTPSAGEAIADFRTKWVTGAGVAGTAANRLTFRQIGGGWKITSESQTRPTS